MEEVFKRAKEKGYPYMAMTLSSIHTWLREAHNLYICIDTCDNYGHWEWRIMSIILTDEGPNIDWEVDAQWNTYELALNNAIVNALSII